MAFKAYAFEETLREEGLGEKEARAIAKAFEEHVIDETLSKSHFERAMEVQKDHFERSLKVQKDHFERSNKDHLERTMDANREQFQRTMAANKDHFDRTMDAKLAEMKYDLLKWTIGIAAGSVFAILVAMLRFQK